MKAVILAGGIGSRLWPMSRTSKPKQFFDLVTEAPLIRDTYERLHKTFPKEKIYFSTSPAFADLIQVEFPDVPADHIIVEPSKRDTGPAMGFVAAILELEDPNEPIVFVPSDHYIRNEKLFLQCLKVGADLIQETGKLLDIAITPTYPSTVLGYTKIGAGFRQVNGIKVFGFAGHKEKPDFETAKKLLSSGNYLWHANYYMWTPKQFVEAFETHAPETGKRLRLLQDAYKSGDQERVAALYGEMEKISFDYAVTEKLDPSEVLIIQGDFGWSDIGSWDALHGHLAGEGGNVKKGNVVALHTHQSLIYAPENKVVTVLGMQRTIVVDTGDALLVCGHEYAQKVKDIVAHLEENGLDQYL